MKFVSKILSRLLFAFFVLAHCAPVITAASNSVAGVKESGVLKVGTNAEFPPFEYWENGKITGIDVDISQKIAEKLGCKLEIEDGSFDSVLIGIQNGTCDLAVSGLTSTPERCKSVDFSVPYFNGSQVVITSNGSSIKSKAELLNKKVGVQTGTTSEEYCKNSGLNVKISSFNKFADAVSDLIAGQLDAVIVDDFAAQKLVNINSSKVHIIDEKLTDESFCVAVKKGNTELLATINECINELKTTGELNKIVDKYYDIGTAASNENAKNDIVSRYKEYVPYILKGLYNTLIMTCIASLLGIAFGMFTSFLKILGNNKKIKFLKYIANAYVTVIRGTPVIVQLFILYYGILSLFKVNKIICASLAFGVNSGAYVAEHIRSGISSVDSGQMEAGLSLGLSRSNVLKHIIFPQAFRNILPSLFGEFINLLKETAVVGYIGVMDLSKAGDIIKSRTYEAFIPLLIIALIYLFITLILTKGLSMLERRLQKIK